MVLPLLLIKRERILRLKKHEISMESSLKGKILEMIAKYFWTFGLKKSEVYFFWPVEGIGLQDVDDLNVVKENSEERFQMVFQILLW
jgi:hypothetical protein